MEQLDKEVIDKLSEPAKRVFRSLDYRSQRRMLKKAKEMGKQKKRKTQQKERVKKKSITKRQKKKEQAKERGSSTKRNQSRTASFVGTEIKDTSAQILQSMLLGTTMSEETYESNSEKQADMTAGKVSAEVTQKSMQGAKHGVRSLYRKRQQKKMQKQAAKKSAQSTKQGIKSASKAIQQVGKIMTSIVQSVAANPVVWIVLLIVLLMAVIVGAIGAVIGSGGAANSAEDYTYQAQVSEQTESYRDMVEDYCEKYGIDDYVDLCLAVIEQESGGNPPDVMQTEQSYYNVNPPIDTAEESIDCGTLGTRQGYHFKFSFSKDETIEAEQALLFIKDWVDEYLAENYDYACSVHKDREHMHMHLVFNSVSRDGGKYRYERGDWENVIRPLTNCLAQKYHTGPLKEKNPALDYSTDYDKKKGNMTGRERVERDMDECILLSKSYADFKNRMVRDFHYRLREGVSREHGVYLALTPPGRGKAIRTYRLSDGYMPVDIDRRIDAKAGKSLLQKSGKRIQSASKLDWAMSRNYQFVPYKEMSDYQKAMVRQVLEARRLYRRTGTPLYLHEQSVRVVQRMKKDTKQCGIYIKRKEVRSTQRELEKVMKQSRRNKTL